MDPLHTSICNDFRTPVLLSGSEEANGINENAVQLENKLKDLKIKIKDILQNPEEKDIAYQKIMPLFEVNSSFNSGKQKAELIDLVFSNAMKRFYRGMPPRKEKDISIGDAFNWEWCLQCCSSGEIKHSLIIVSRDSDFADPANKKKINPFLKDEFKRRIGEDYSVKLELSLKNALEEINLEMSQAIEAELDKVQKNSQRFEDSLREGECCRCGDTALFDVYCQKCGELVVGDADGDNYYVRGNRVFQFDPDGNGNGELLHCPHCRSARMEIEYGNLCGYCQHMLDEELDE